MYLSLLELNSRIKIKECQVPWLGWSDPTLHESLGRLVSQELHTFVMASAILIVIRAQH